MIDRDDAYSLAAQQAEKTLLKAGALQRAIFNSANFSCIATDANGVIQIFNVGAERMLGYSAAEVVNKITPADISDPEEIVVRAAALSSELSTPIMPGFEALVFKASRGIEDIYELTYHRKDGSRFPAVVSVTALRDAPGGIIGYLLIGTDNTARQRAEAEITRHQLVTQSIVDTIRDPLVVLESDMTIVMASKAFLTMFETTETAALGRRISDLGQRQWDVPAFRDLMEKVLPEDKPIEGFEIEDNFPGLGLRVFSLNARKIFRPGNNAHRLLLVFEDITDRKQRERDAALLTNEISHRIKNNLQLIAGMITYESRSATGPSVQGYKAMQARINAIAKLYDLISHSSRSGAITISAYLKEIAKAISATLLGNESGIVIDVEAEAVDIEPDRAVPFGLLVNELVTNAIKHAFPDMVGRVLLKVVRRGGDIELTVADNGTGMGTNDVVVPSATRGLDYITIFVRQLGGSIIPSELKESGTILRIRFPWIAAPPSRTGRVAA